MINRTNADELMIVSDIFDPEHRRKSFEIIAQANSEQSGSGIRLRLKRDISHSRHFRTFVTSSIHSRKRSKLLQPLHLLP